MVVAVVPATLLLLLDDSKALGHESEGVLAVLESNRKARAASAGKGPRSETGGALAGVAAALTYGGGDEGEDDYRRPLLEAFEEEGEDPSAYQVRGHCAAGIGDDME